MNSAATAGSDRRPLKSDSPTSESPEPSSPEGGYSTTRIVATKEKCQGHARCLALAPDLVGLDDNGYIGFDELAVPEDQVEAARSAVESCPERALALVVADGR